jgi:hypothetical protein
MINHWSDRVTGLELAAVERAEELLRFAEVPGERLAAALRD